MSMSREEELRRDKLILVITSEPRRTEHELRDHLVQFDRHRLLGVLTGGLPFRICVVQREWDMDRLRGLRPDGIIFLGLRPELEDFVRDMCAAIFPGAETSVGMPRDPELNFYGDRECPECGCSDWGEPMFEKVEVEPTVAFWVEDLSAPMRYAARSYRVCNYCGEKKYD